MAEEHAGFANTLNAKGEYVDATKVKAFTDKSDAGKVRSKSQKAKTAITRTPDTSTDGFPAAKVPAPKAEGEGANAG